MAEDPRDTSLREAIRNLYLSVTIFGVVGICLGFNFLLTVPTFEQFGIPKAFIGTGFLALGIALLFVLNIKNLVAVRLVLMCNIAYMFFWGIGTTQTFFEGTSSLQLFILYWGMAILQVPLVLQPAFYGLHGVNGIEKGERR